MKHNFNKLRNILIVSILPLVALSACQSSDVKAFGEARGIAISDQDAVRVADYFSRPQAVFASTGSVEAMIRSRWAGTGHEDRAVRIARCESGLNPGARNRSSSASGIFQLIASHWRGKFDPFDARANIEYAFKLWKSSGWRPWVCKG